MLDPKTVNMFHFSGAKYTTPNCPIEMSPEFNPSGGANYEAAGKDCKKNARYNAPFFSSKPAAKYEEWSTNAHEGRPGHHTQVSDGRGYVDWRSGRAGRGGPCVMTEGQIFSRPARPNSVNKHFII